MQLPILKRCCRHDYRQFRDGEHVNLERKRKRKRRKKEKKADWGNLMPEILLEIVKRLATMESYEYFGSVCRSWRAAADGCLASEFPQRKTTLEGPWLMLPGEAEKEKEEEEDREFIVISRRILLGGRVTRKIYLPRGVGVGVGAGGGVTKHQPTPHPHHKYSLSCKDWLLVVSGEDEPSLFHPFSGRQIRLPNFDGFLPHIWYDPTDRRHNIIHKFELSADPLSTPDYDLFVIVIWGDYYKLGFCKPGDTCWKVPKVDLDYPCPFSDILYNCDDNKLYATNCEIGLVMCDIHGPDPTKTTLLGIVWREHCLRSYLLKWKKNKLLLVYHYWDKNGRRNPAEWFRVAEFDTKDGTHVEVTHIGNNAVFVGRNSSFHLGCSGFNKLMPNCIYFTGDNSYIFNGVDYASLERLHSSEVGIYNIWERSYKCLFRYVGDEDGDGDGDGVLVGTKLTPPALWIGPSF